MLLLAAAQAAASSWVSGKNRVTSRKRESVKRGLPAFPWPSGVGPVPDRQRETELRGLRASENGDLTLSRPDLFRFRAFSELSRSLVCGW
jgi:hypothetical protein